MVNTLENIDHTLLLAINGLHTPLADSFFWLVSEGWLFTPLFIFLAIYIYKLKKLKFLLTAIVFVALTVLFCDQSSNFVKNSVQRYRPTHNLDLKNQIHIVHDTLGGTFGFFSAHSANSMGVSIFLFLCLSWVDKKYRLLIFAWPLLSGYSRIYIGVHYPSDVIAGYLAGLIWGFAFYKMFERLLPKLNSENE